VDVSVGEIRLSEVAVPRRAPAPVYAAIDLGTNNCRLLIARPSSTGFRVIDAFSRIVRLGEGLSRTGNLSDEAIERTLAALHVCQSKLRKRGASVFRAVGTEACRRAANREDFLTAVDRETGLNIEIISSDEEGRLAIAGCAPLLDPAIPYALVFDIGGGSTELMWVKVDRGVPPRVIDQVSVPCGVIGLTERYGGDRVENGAFRLMVGEVLDAIEPFEDKNGIRRLAAEGQVQLLGTSGTVTTLAGLHLSLPRYDRRTIDGSYLRVEHARTVIRHLLTLDFNARAAHPCIGQERADLVIAGCAVLEAICDCWPVVRLRIADRGLREGILVDLIGGGR
jgi:exopolyphosphatase / guanosine-5'-triphosphate,3'-diphosphate pyrophosphatase